ncbi:MAG: response regulator [Polyangiaceae bacterium]|nr:response regulator [Polyangiaceae bacterium]
MRGQQTPEGAGTSRPVIVHVEDDPDLASMVQDAFERFGFRGTTHTFATVGEALAWIDAASARGEPIDLIITDMRLPDGLGLEVVRHARHRRPTSRTPILVLSGDPDPQHVESAYSLGANAFVAKSGSRRAMLDVVRTLYEHWVEDARLPPSPHADRLQDLLARVAAGRGRHADFFLRVANDLSGEDEEELGFWLASALREANLANLLSFLRNVTERDLSNGLLLALEALERGLEHDLDEVERLMQRAPISTREEAYRRALALERSRDAATIARAIAYAFPAAPAGLAALRDVISGNLRALGTWIEAHATEPATRERAAQITRDAGQLEDLVRAEIAREPRPRGGDRLIGA